MKKIVIAAVMAAASLGAVAAQDAAKPETFGKGVSAKTAVAISDLYATPEKFTGKTVRIDGIVTDVCTDMGCWMAIASEQEPALIVRIKVEDGGDIVFPVSAKGRKVSAEGVFEKIKAGDKDSQEGAAEMKASGAKAEAFGKTYQLKGLGAYVY
jgi:hypothetical protein